MSLFANARKGDNNLWNYGLGIFIVFLGYFVGQLPLFFMTKLAISNDPDFGVEEYNRFNNEMDFSIIGLSSNMGFLLLILMFVFAMFGLLLILNFQKKKIQDLITTKRKVDFNKIFFGFGLWFLIGVVFEIVLYVANPGDYSFEFKPLSFFILMIICLVALPIQTSFEELFFRGYIMQGATNFHSYKWFGLLISTLFFAFVHGANPEVSEYGAAPMMIYYLIAGAFLGIVTILDDSLELALGVHWATNLFGALFLSYKGSVLQTDTLFKSEAVNPWVMTLFFICTAALFLYICARKYDWRLGSFATLFGKIEYEDAWKPEVNPTIETIDETIVSNTNYESLFNENKDEGEHEEIS